MLNKNNKRSSILKFLFLMGFAIAVTGCGADDKKNQVYQWTIQSQATASSLDFKELLNMVDNINKMSSGRLVITAHPGGVITGGADIFSAVAERRVEMGSGWPNWWSAQHPAWAVMNAGPFDFMNIDASMMFFLAGNGTEMANKLSASQGILWRAAWWPGMEFGLLSTSPITGIDDLKEKKVRIGPGLPSEVLAAATDAYALPLVPEEIRPALESGDLDAVEWTTTAGAWDLGLQNLAKYAIVPAIWQPSVLADFLINQQAYDELPDDLQAILETAIKSYTLTTTLKSKVQDFKALKDFKANGTQLNTWSKADIEKWRVVSDKVLKKYSEQDEFTKNLILEKQKFKKEYVEYYQLFGNYDQ